MCEGLAGSSRRQKFTIEGKVRKTRSQLDWSLVAGSLRKTQMGIVSSLEFTFEFDGRNLRCVGNWACFHGAIG